MKKCERFERLKIFGTAMKLMEIKKNIKKIYGKMRKRKNKSFFKLHRKSHFTNDFRSSCFQSPVKTQVFA